MLRRLLYLVVMNRVVLCSAAMTIQTLVSTNYEVAVVSLAMMCYVKWICLFYGKCVLKGIIGGNGPIKLAPSMRWIVTYLLSSNQCLY